MSRLGEIMQEERERRGVSQKELARVVGVDRSMISHYELGRRTIPHDVLCSSVRALGSNKLRIQACFECQINLLTMPYLDKVDMHPMTVITVLIEELQEASEALLALKLANKRSADDLTAQDHQAMAHAGEQVVDLLAGINTLLGGWQEWYGFDVDRQAVDGYEKLFTKGYATRQEYGTSRQVA